MAHQPLLMGIDLGTGSVKVLLTGTDGRIAGKGAAEYGIVRPSPERAEQHPDAWWRGVVDATRAALADASRRSSAGPKPADRILAIGLSGQMHGLTLMSGAHVPLAAAVVWPDQRSGKEVTDFTESFGSEAITRLSGGRLATGFMAATLLWLRKHDRALLSQAAWFMSPKDALRLRMTGEVATEPSDGSGTGLLNPATRRWAAEVVAAIGIDPDRLPPLLEASTVAGSLAPGGGD